MPFELTILGCSSATPTSNRNPTAQVLNVRERFFLIDCAEGTQRQLRRQKVKFAKINHIFISHLHGDHYFGLVGLLSSFHLMGREKELHLYGPEPLQEILQVQFKASNTWLKFPLIFHPLNPAKAECIYDGPAMTVDTLLMKHSVDCWGFVFREKERERKILRSEIDAYGIEVCDIHRIKQGFDHELSDGTVIPNKALTLDPPRPRSYAFFSDTAYQADLAPVIKAVDLLYHEATFANDMVAMAQKTKHSTAAQAAQLAEKADVKQLVIGHFSARYKDLNLLLDEAQAIFPNTTLAEDGLTFTIPLH